MKAPKLKTLLTPPPNADKAWFQKRGRDFELVLNKFLSDEDMEPRTNMRPTGEEIDGSFAMGDRFFLLEAKWHADPIPASSLYAFKGKVDGKLIGTIGAFFSMSDYSPDAVDALLFGKALNLILFGHKDLSLINDGKITMQEAMRVKLRYATNYGQPFFALEIHLKELAASKKRASTSKHRSDWIILVESASDAQTIDELLKKFNIKAEFEVFPAGGQLSVAPLAKYLTTKYNSKKHNLNLAAIITPSPDSQLQKAHIRDLESYEVQLVNLSSSLEDWLSSYVPVDYDNTMTMFTNSEGKMAKRYASRANPDKLLAENPTFSALIDNLKAAPKNSKSKG